MRFRLQCATKNHE